MENTQITNLYAKSVNGKYTVSLMEHAVNKAEWARFLSKSLKNDTNDIMQILSYVVGLLHDIGKCTEKFQHYLLTVDNADRQEHNVYGAKMLSNLCNDIKIDGITYKNVIIACVLEHHPYNKEVCKEARLTDRDYSTAISLINVCMDIMHKEYGNRINIQLNEHYKRLRSDDWYSGLPSTFVGNNYNKDLCLYLGIILKRADVMKDGSIVSLNEASDSIRGIDFAADIKRPDGYDDRYIEQLQSAIEISNTNKKLCHVNATTGYGKTLIGLLSSLHIQKHVYWICPQINVARSVYYNVLTELKALRLSDKITTSLLCNGKVMEGCDDADIKVAVYDTFARPIIKSDNNQRMLYDILSNTCIVDEYHVYAINNQSLLSSFLSIVRTKIKYTDSKVILMSATPNPYIINEITDYDDDAVYTIKRHNETSMQKKFRIHYIKPQEIRDVVKEHRGCLVSTQSVLMAQSLCQDGVVDQCIHSWYAENDKKVLFEQLLVEHGKHSQVEEKTSWSATDILSAACDVSFDALVMIYPLPDRMIQTLGRIDRWSVHKDETTDIYIIDKESAAIPNEMKVLDIMSPNTSRKQNALLMISQDWSNEIKKLTERCNVVTRKDLYELRDAFQSKLEELYGTYCAISNAACAKLRYTHAYHNVDDSVTKISDKQSYRHNSGDMTDIYVRVADYESEENITQPTQLLPEVFQVPEYKVLSKFDDNKKREILHQWISTFDGYKRKRIQKKLENDLCGLWDYYANNIIRSSDTPLLLMQRSILSYHKRLGLLSRDVSMDILIDKYLK